MRREREESGGLGQISSAGHSLSSWVSHGLVSRPYCQVDVEVQAPRSAAIDLWGEECLGMANLGVEVQALPSATSDTTLTRKGGSPSCCSPVTVWDGCGGLVALRQWWKSWLSAKLPLSPL